MDTAPACFPSADKLRIGFIGAGRVGKALAWSLAGAGLRVSAVASVTLANARALVGPIAGCVTTDAQAVVDSCDLVFFTTPDGAITPYEGTAVAAMAALPGSTITLEASEPLMSALEALTQRLDCRVNRLPPGMRDRYHAAAGYTSQFINALFGEATAI